MPVCSSQETHLRDWLPYSNLFLLYQSSLETIPFLSLVYI
ncbi:hypothetical protein FDUTEX481_05345 [Tolypothrix sp. PCC 7601]|nr:hypothetical protein FDUTEX481_05345 [Tolypothrix sp. PCC 7601]